ncbi:putative metallo-hydrolase [Candidatus Phycosocius bacilliformis]|uniref:Putative metallo-hydrolase n=1 Tax=Candidatus Phycosocius bacilliformis TaxID=1445552 RepID=A0A2P2E9R1_9PROT|nr:MBL fold metallo-hydrolase [Candidatus Phycosocius bacilliformis]GBF57802.1 putative metallo-hydrolase [Candidatus Phycosocius bacilliformis]
MSEPRILAFFDEPTFTVTYLVIDPASARAVIVDPVLDYDHRSGAVSTTSAQAVLDAASAHGVAIDFILETHVHADHLSAAPFLKAQTGAKVVIGHAVDQVQRTFGPVFHADDLSLTGAEFDVLAEDGAKLHFGQQSIEVMHVPGHTPACVAYRIGDHLFVGDTLFMPDYGTARCDFPGGDASALYRSIQKMLALPPHTKLWMCHDYKAPGRDYFAWESDVASQRAHNIHIHDGVSEADFVAMRETRDKGLSAPVLLLPSVQVNMRAGHFPPAESDGKRFLKVPVSGQIPT